jgi:hypothetical protein
MNLPPENGVSYAFCLGPLRPVALNFSDGAWRVEVPADQTAALKPGPAAWQLWQTEPASRLVASGSIAIMPSLLLGHDTRTHDQRVLAALRDALLRLAETDEVEISIHNRTVKFQDPQKIQALIDHYQNLVNRAAGRGALSTIPVRLR